MMMKHLDLIVDRGNRKHSFMSVHPRTVSPGRHPKSTAHGVWSVDQATLVLPVSCITREGERDGETDKEGFAQSTAQGHLGALH